MIDSLVMPTMRCVKDRPEKPSDDWLPHYGDVVVIDGIHVPEGVYPLGQVFRSFVDPDEFSVVIPDHGQWTLETRKVAPLPEQYQEWRWTPGTDPKAAQAENGAQRPSEGHSLPLPLIPRGLPVADRAYETLLAYARQWYTDDAAHDYVQNWVAELAKVPVGVLTQASQNRQSLSATK